MTDWFVSRKFRTNEELQTLLQYLDVARQDLERSNRSFKEANDRLQASLGVKPQ